MLVSVTLTTSAVLTVSLHVELAEARRVSFCIVWRNAGNSYGGELSTYNGVMGGGGTLAGANSSVVARTTGGGRVTTGIIVDETLVGVEGGDRIKGSTMEGGCGAWIRV